MDEGLPDLQQLNATELASIVRRQTGVVVKRSVPRLRLIELIEYGLAPLPEEAAKTNETRKVLQLFIEKNWSWVNSQIPCKGENMGRCTVYPCPEGRHLDCYLAAKDQIRVNMRLPDDP